MHSPLTMATTRNAIGAGKHTSSHYTMACSLCYVADIAVVVCATH